MSWLMFIAFLATLILPVVAVVGVVAYIRRTRHLQDSLGDGSLHAAVLDSLDQVHVRLDAMSDRLTRLEGTVRFESLTARRVQEPGEARDMSLSEGRE